MVIPCYRSEASIGELLDRLVAQLESMGEPFEIVCVDDASPDGVAEVIRGAHERDARIKLVRLFRNYGQHHALLTGFRFARGAFVITMDDDLQHPPEEIGRLVEGLGDNDVVIGAAEVKQHGLFQNLGSRLMRLVLRVVFKRPRGFVSSAFRLLRRDVAQQLAASRTAYPYLAGMILQLTSKVANVPFRHEPRRHGRTNYSLPKLVLLASNLLINYTKLPLHVLVVAGLVISVLSFAFILYIVIGKLFFIDFQVGWSSVIVVVSFFGGLHLLAFAIVGEYLIRILNEASSDRRPVIRELLLGPDA